MMTESVDTSAAGRMWPVTVARRVVEATHHGVREAWIAEPPAVLLLCELVALPPDARVVLLQCGAYVHHRASDALIVAATHRGVREAYLAKQPVLFLSEWPAASPED